MSLFSKKIKSFPMNKVLSELMQDSTIRLIDVRSKEEFRGGRIPNAINVPIENIQSITNFVSNKDTRLFVYCFSGGRSYQAVHFLNKMGYTDVSDLGGIVNYSGKIEK